jgi:two-component system, OmpR family, response regulator
MQRLLVVDDDQDICSLLVEQLSDAGYYVTAASSGQAMRRAIEAGRIDLIVLDLNMPDEDGLVLCRELRATSTTPVIMLTARGDPIDRIVGLEMGADDYLPKPFEPRELLARIRSVLRRAETASSIKNAVRAKRARFSGWLFDLERRYLLHPAGQIVMLSGSEFRLLLAFVTHANQVLSRDQLIAFGGKRRYEAQDRAIDLQVSRLRQKIGNDGEAGSLIKTVRSEGYVFACDVEFQ